MPRRPGICLTDLVPTPVVVAIDRKQIDPHHRLRISLFYAKFVSPRYGRPVVVTAPPL